MICEQFCFEKHCFRATNVKPQNVWWYAYTSISTVHNLRPSIMKFAAVHK